MNQVDLPDPVMDSLTELRQENERLRAQLLELQKKKENKEKDKKEKKDKEKEKKEKNHESL